MTPRMGFEERQGLFAQRRPAVRRGTNGTNLRAFRQSFRFQWRDIRFTPSLNRRHFEPHLRRQVSEETGSLRALK